MSTVDLPVVVWGDSGYDRRALLVHGLGSDAHTMWRIGEHLADTGWCAIAIDQRGHGRAPRTSSYRIEEYARDILAVPHDAPWDLALGHSIGGASLVAASAIEPGFASRLVLVDPALATNPANRDDIRANQVRNHRELTVEKQRETFPHWHTQDIESSVNAVRAASEFALEHSVLDNPDWDVLTEAERLTVPTLVFQGDPGVVARYTDEHAARIEASNPLVTRTMIPDTGHNVHRDNPDEFCARLSAWLNA